MHINDQLYGDWEINESVLLELLVSEPVQRLKGIAQYGVPDPYYHLKNYSRYKHSVGVMLLLRRLGASLEEQVAGLLHDVSHTAFSHVIDWVVGEGKTENFQDEQHEEILTRSAIPEILTKHGFLLDRITNYHLFKLLEREAPDLCADRVDYALREIPGAIGQEIIQKLRVKNKNIVMADKAGALLFGREYLKLQINHWGGFEAASRYRLFANLLREALEKKVITMVDFGQDDAYVINKILESGDWGLEKQLKALENKSLAALPKSKVVVYKKFRYVDPLFIDGDNLVRASEADIEFKKEIEDARQENGKGIRIAEIAL